MTRQTTTVMLDDVGCGGGSAHTIERALQDVPGVLHAYVNPATEAAYVEFDADRCARADLVAAVESVGVHTLSSVGGPTRAASAPSPTSQFRRSHVPNTTTHSRAWWAFVGFAAIAAFFLLTEHRAHLYGVLPFVFLAACPLLHMFGHGGHGGHGSHGSHGAHTSDTPPARGPNSGTW